MTEEAVVEQSPVVEAPVAVESAPTEVSTTPAPEKKKRGRKPKVAIPPPTPTVQAAKPRKRRVQEARPSKGERAITAAVSAAQVDRVKCIEELTKVMQMQYSKEGVLKTLDWKIQMLTGNQAPYSHPNLQSLASGQPQYPAGMNYPPMPPAYPQPSAPQYIPPAMRAAQMPVEPRANGGAEGIVDDTDNDDPDKFLKVGGVIGGGFS